MQTIRERDFELAQRLSKGDENAFNSIFALYRQEVEERLNECVYHHRDVSDLVQEVFLKLWKSRAHLSDVENFQGYLQTMTFNCWRNYLKHEAIEFHCIKEFASMREEHFEDPLPHLDFRELSRFIDHAIAKLAPQKRKIYKLAKFGTMSYKEAAAKFGISQMTIRNHVAVAKAQVQNSLRMLCYP